MKYLLENNIETRRTFIPLSKMKIYRKFVKKVIKILQISTKNY